MTQIPTPLAVETTPPNSTTFSIVAIAASAGGLKAISRVLASLPGDFPLPLVVVQHLDPRHRSLIADILGWRTPLRVKQADDGDTLDPATVYIAPPNNHLLVKADHTISLTQSAVVHFVRPSADLLFKSVAEVFRERAIAVVLSGAGGDGAEGVMTIKQLGGTVFAQDRATAEFFGMPGAAIETGVVDFTLPLDEIAYALIKLTGEGHYP